MKFSKENYDSKKKTLKYDSFVSFRPSLSQCCEDMTDSEVNTVDSEITTGFESPLSSRSSTNMDGSSSNPAGASADLVEGSTSGSRPRPSHRYDYD